MAEKVKGTLLNMTNHPMYIAYFGETLVLSPRQKVKKVEKAKLGALPKGVVFVESKE